MKTICFDATTLLGDSRRGGIGSYCRGLIDGFSRAGNLLDGLDLRILLGPASLVDLVPLAEAVERVEASYVDTKMLGDIEYFAFKHAIASAAVKDAGLSLYHSPEPVGTCRVPRAARLVTCHDLIPIVLDYPYDVPLAPRRLRKTVERRRFASFDHAIAISRCTADDLFREARFPRDRTSLVHQGLDHTTFHPRAEPNERTRVSEALGSDRPYFLYIGGYDRRRQVPQTVQAFARHAHQMPDQLLVLCGNVKDATLDAVRAIVARHRLQDRVLLPGFVPDALVPALYRNATAHLMLSLYEGFGMTAVEAMACGCPVLCLDASCMPEILGDAALFVPAVARAGEAMVRLTRDFELRGTLHRAGLQRAARYSWDRCARKTLEVYRKLLNI